jgi:hypothetical protein
MIGSCVYMHTQLAKYPRYAEASNGEIGTEVPLQHAEGVVSAPISAPGRCVGAQRLSNNFLYHGWSVRFCRGSLAKNISFILLEHYPSRRF